MATDGELYGLRLALGDVQNGLARKDNEYEALLRTAQDRIAEFEAHLRLARAERDAARNQCEKLKVALALEQCHSAGLMAKGDAYKGVVQQVYPGDALLQETGLSYKDGVKEKHSDRVYDKAFDAKAASLGLVGTLRTVAK